MRMTAPPSDVTSRERTIRVIVAGPDGQMGRVMMRGLPAEPDIEVVGGLRRSDAPRSKELLAGADVLVDFTRLDSSPQLLLDAIDAGVCPVSGTSGLSEEVLSAVDAAARKQGIGAVWAPHFRLAGVLMVHLAREAARFMSSVEIVEGHHATKADAPSGFAMELARNIREAHGADLVDPPVSHTVLSEARGGLKSGVRVHSIRLPDLSGWHEALFGGTEELLSIRHDEFGREGYVATVARSIREVMRPGLVGLLRGYDAVIGLTSTR